MTMRSRTAPLLSLVVLVAIAAGWTVSGQGQPPTGAQGRGQGQGRGRGEPPPPPPPQAGHPSGKLVIWGDLASFDVPATLPTHCILTNRFKHGQRLGIRMTAIDGGSGETENTAVLTAHLMVAGQTVDVPMRWRGVGIFATALRNVDRRVGRARGCTDRDDQLHGDGRGSIRPNRVVCPVHQRRVPARHRRIMT
jgi:hypothetical protein